MESEIDIFDLAYHGLKVIEQKALDLKCAEIFFEKNRYISLEIEENSISSSETGDDNGVSIRVINKKGALGFAFSNILKKETIDDLCNISLKMMNVSTPDPDFYNLPASYQRYPNEYSYRSL
ncbi:MAG: PmbA/TldA family metallopeptidase [Promethearchaeota archaeon]|jgi:predicted Zn-dependent protease